jgi:hypothetical protein
MKPGNRFFTRGAWKITVLILAALALRDERKR